ncbi:hypothetical protein L195_g046521, partial [Trifolium pratense]
MTRHSFNENSFYETLNDFLGNPALEFVGFLDPLDVVNKLLRSQHRLVLNAPYCNLRKYLSLDSSCMSLTDIIDSELGIKGYDDQISVASLVPFAAFHIGLQRQI